MTYVLADNGEPGAKVKEQPTGATGKTSGQQVGQNPSCFSSQSVYRGLTLGMASIPSPVKISYEDVAEECVFWETSVVCYVLGANPPLHVINGFVNRIWNPVDIDKVGTIDKGVFLVRLKSQEALRVACDSNCILFDKKSLIVTPWSKNVSYEKESISSSPV